MINSVNDKIDENVETQHDPKNCKDLDCYLKSSSFLQDDWFLLIVGNKNI